MHHTRWYRYIPRQADGFKGSWYRQNRAGVGFTVDQAKFTTNNSGDNDSGDNDSGDNDSGDNDSGDNDSGDKSLP
ncbi:hypothetical protein BS17DRAFT_818255 [Gyrodon lividus]|nr:hypothetical protein BS17DRAFT_818255 [Gyrodon lividus]